MYLVNKLAVPGSKALYALSLYVVGMAVMRIVIGSIFRKMPSQKILALSFAFLLVGCLLLKFSTAYFIAVAGLILLGAGLAAGFPVMLGFVGNRYASLSATAFSLVLVIALAGNMFVNFLMGVISENYGIQHLTTVAFALLIFMIFSSFFILRKNKL